MMMWYNDMRLLVLSYFNLLYKYAFKSSFQKLIDSFD